MFSSFQTVPVLMNNLYALAVNEEVQDKVYQEICAESGGKSDSQYLKAVMKETFRLVDPETLITWMHSTKK